MRFFKDKHPDEDGTTYIRVHYASCRYRFLHGITPHVQLHESEKFTWPKFGSPHNNKSPLFSSILANIGDFEELDFLLSHDEKHTNMLNTNITLLKWFIVINLYRNIINQKKLNQE